MVGLLVGRSLSVLGGEDPQSSSPPSFSNFLPGHANPPSLPVLLLFLLRFEHFNKAQPNSLSLLLELYLFLSLSFFLCGFRALFPGPNPGKLPLL